jgi:two-component system, sensor histidine kinase LadS
MLLKLLRLTLITVLAWISAPAMAGMAVAEVDAGSDRLVLSPFVSYYHDVEGQNDAINMADLVAQGKFKPLPNGNATFGFNKGAHWLHASLRNRGHSEQRWLLVLQYPLLDYIDVHIRYANGETKHLSSGDMQPFSSRSISYRQPNFWIDLPRNEKVELLVRITSKSSIQAPLVIFTSTAFAETERDSQFSIGIYNGIIVALFFYNLVMWLLLRDQNNLWYVLHITGFGLVLFCLNGLAFEYLWPNSPWLANHSIPLSMCLSQLAMHQFTRIFLSLPSRMRKFDRISIGFIAFYVLMTVASLVIDYSLAVKAITYSVFPGIVWVLTLSIMSINAGYKPAKLFLIAWAALLSGTFVYASVSFGLLPKIFITEYGIQIGSALEMLLLSFALAYRYAELKKENMQLVFQSKEQLEASVAKRTTELSQALEQLAEANARLRESSQRDSLTGLLNRRHFREQFELLIKQAESSRKGLGVLLIDIDYFKAINDHHGHLAGDECLRTLSKTLALTVAGQQGCTARFGGEEFVIIVPNCDIHKLEKLAETIRKRIEDEEIKYASKSIRITTSIGAYCSSSSENINADDALRCADEALYEAKNKGRNRVEVYKAITNVEI